MTKRFAVASTIAVLIGLFVGRPAHGLEPGPFTLQCDGEDAVTITQPGTYRLAHAKHDCGSKRLIVIAASSVTVDLSWFEIEGTDDGCLAGVDVDGVQGGVKITNGTISDCDVGIEFTSGLLSRIEKVTVASTDGDGIRAGSNTVTKVTARHIGETGISSHGGLVDHSVVKGAADGGIVATNSTVEDNTVTDGKGSDGIDIFGGALRRNIVTGTFAGIFGHNDTVIEDNKTNDNEVGISVFPDSTTIDHVTVTGNHANDNTSTGIRLAGPIDTSTVQVSGNTVKRNGTGIDLFDDDVPHDSAGTNVARHNTANPQCDGGLCD